MTELLSPVGSMECLMAAINAGCDAVYFAGRNFGARMFASNFSDEDIIKAINICHLYGVKAYITVNTLIYDNEVERFLKYVDFIYKQGADAIIMQDIGMIDLVRKTYPNLVIHVSTQAHIHNLEGVKLMETLGVKRVVLARETPIELVNEIKKNSNIEIEVFVHGALCMSYSGECLMSALIGSRSGNRGTCAQCCRQKYSLEVDNKIVLKDKYLLSTKDLNTLNYINKLVSANIDSLKIEGRMKSKEYVYLTTSIYRLALDNYKKYGNTKITEEDFINLKKIFNREFTKGFLFNEDNDSYTNIYRPNHMGVKIGEVIDYKNNEAIIKLTDNLNINDGIRILSDSDIGFIVTKMYKDLKFIKSAIKSDIIRIKTPKVKIKSDVLKTSDYLLINDLNKKMNINKKIKINGAINIRKNSPIKFSINDSSNSVCVVSDYIVEESITSKITKEKVLNQINRFGDTIYVLENLNIKMDEDVFIPIQVLNDLRRKAVLELNNLRMYKNKYIKSNYSISVKDYKRENLKTLLVNDYDSFIKNYNKYDLIYIDKLELYNKVNDNKCILKIPRVQEHLKDYNMKLLVGDLGSLYKYKNVDTDFSLNITNSYSVAYLHSIGVNKITLSYELNYKQVKNLIECYKRRYNKKPNVEVITSARCEAMVCKYNMIKKYKGKNFYLVDRFNNKYKLVYKDNLMYIYDYKRILKDYDYYSIGVNSIRTNMEDL